MELKIYESLFNSFVTSLYDRGALNHTKQVTKAAVKTVFRVLQVFRQPLRLRNTLAMEVGLTEVPRICIKQRDGVTVNARARVQVFKHKAHKTKTIKTRRNLFSVSTRLKVTAKVAITGQALTVPSYEVSCSIETKTWFRNAMVKCVNSFLTRKVKSILHGAQFPLPKVVDFSQGKIEYHEGYLMVVGHLDVTPAGVQMVKEKFGELMKHI